MGDTRERSSNSDLQPQCPCGFWGSSQTMNLCSKCFADIQKKQECSVESAASSQSHVFSLETSGSSSQSRSLAPPTEASAGEETSVRTLCSPTKRPRESASGLEKEESPQKRSRLAEKGGGAEEEEEKREVTEEEVTLKQKNRRRCFYCQMKLELVTLEMGECRCGFLYCMRHRLPEQHHCPFDHLSRGREEAGLKMVKLDRKVGRSCQRIGEECS